MAMAMWYSDPMGIASSSTYTSTSSATNIMVWPIWCNQTPSATTTGSVWHSWVDNSTGGRTYYPSQAHMQAQMHCQPEPTPEEIERAEAQAEENRKAAEKKEEERKTAHARAMKLLREHLTEKQKKALDKHGWFLVEGGKSKKTYRIHAKSFAGNITEMNDKKKDIARYCVHADYSIPIGDHLLTQMLHLRHDEEFILSKANKTALAA